MSKGVIVITECPKCGEMKAARSAYAAPPRDADGHEIPNGVHLFAIECFGCIELPRVEWNSCTGYPVSVEFGRLHPNLFMAGSI